MKYIVLLTGNNKMTINEFFTYMDFNFECVTTSNRYDDIINHLKYVHPDVFVYCLYGEMPDDIKRFFHVARKISEQNIPIVVIGDTNECGQFIKIAPTINATFIYRPTSAQKLESSVLQIVEQNIKDGGRNRWYGAGLGSAAADGELIGLPEASAGDAAGVISPSARVEALRAALLAAQAQEESAQVQRRKHILIVDDDSSVLKLLKGYLAERYDVAAAISGKVALKFLELKKTDLVLLDYEMPEENGASVLAKIRSNEKTKDLPVIFLTGLTDRNKIQELLAMKLQGYLLKPIDLEKLSSTIKGVLG